MKPLTLKTRGAIIYGYKCRQSCRTIAKQLGCGKSTVNDIIKRYHETHSLTPKKQSGRPPLLDYQLSKGLRLLLKKTVKIVDFVQKKLQLFGQPKQSNLFLVILYAATLRKLDSQLVFHVVNLQ